MGRGGKVLYSFGSLAAAVSYQAFMMYITFYYVDILKLPAAKFGLAWLVFFFWNTVNDPLFGQWSDRTRTRWGRRIPFIALGTIPFALSFYFLWVPPYTVAQEARLFWYLLGSMFLFDTFFTLVALNWTALYPEMFPGLQERAEVSVWRQALGVAGLACGMAVPPILYQAIGWGWIGAILAAITLVTMFLSLLGSRERPEFAAEEGIGFRRALVYTFTSRSFLSFGVANFGVTLAMGVIQATFAFFAKYILHVEGVLQSAMLGTAFVVTLPALLVWRRITVRRGARAALIGTAVSFGLVSLGFLLVNGLALGFLVCGALGFGLAGLMLLPDVLLADVVDEDELRSGRRREGMFFGINGLFIRAAQAVQGAFVIVPILALFRYNSYAAEQLPITLWGFRLLMSVIPLLALALTIGALTFYPLHGHRLEEIKEGIARRRALP